MMVDKVIEDDTLRTQGSGFTLGVRLPWYRSLPLSDVEVASVSVDREPVAPEKIRFGLNGQEWSLSELPALTRQFWFVLDSAQLRVQDRPLQADSEHDIEVVLAVYPPYIRGLQRLVRWTKRLRVHRDAPQESQYAR